MKLNTDLAYIENPPHSKNMTKRKNIIVAQEQSSKWRDLHTDGQHDIHYITLSFSPHRFKNSNKAAEILEQRIREFYEEILKNEIIKFTISNNPEAKPRISMFLGDPLFSPNEEFLYCFRIYKRVYSQGLLALPKGIITGEELVRPFNGRVYTDLESCANLCKVDIMKTTDYMPSPANYILNRYASNKGICKQPINFPE